MSVVSPMSHWTSTSIPSFAQGLHVLLVDHIEDSLTWMTNVLQNHSYKVVSAQLVSIALSMITKQKQHFDLVIASADMPDMDIISFLRKLRKDIPVIMISSAKDIKAAMLSLAEGASFFLMKPILDEDIKYLWQHVYRKKKSPGDLVLKKLIEAKRCHDIVIEAKNMENGRDEDGEEGQKKGKKNKMREGQEISFGKVNHSKKKKKRVVWSEEQCLKFKEVLSQLDKSKIMPTTIWKMMKDPNLTRRQVANHLQKYKSQVHRINVKDKGKEVSRFQSFRTPYELQQVNSSNYLQIPGIYTANFVNFDYQGMYTNPPEDQIYSYGSYAYEPNMLIDQQTEEFARQQCPNFDDNDEFLTYLNLESQTFEDSNATVNKSGVTGGGSSSYFHINQLDPLKQYVDMLAVLEEDNGIEQNFSEVDKYCDWLKEDLFEEEKGKGMV